MSTMVPLLLVAAVVLVLSLWVVSAYNRLISLSNMVDAAWAQTDVQLKRRSDLIPNLVQTVKGYATHEQQTFETVMQARNAALNATGSQARTQAENALTGAIKSVFAVAEAYPELKANQGFLSLQTELTTTESFIAACRSNYNDAVLAFNTAMQMFPVSVLAGLFHFPSREFFGAPTPAEREPAQVQF
ncbi:MAG TPA: LemA family protein [Verrucomicrobiae bacterium]|nr:LemA family protein [Verrucomicrobiae bacterium]